MSLAKQTLMDTMASAQLVSDLVTTFADLWRGGKAALTRHVQKRLADGHIEDAADYAQKTASGLADATVYSVARGGYEPMIGIESETWFVIYTLSGRLVTSYPTEPLMESFVTQMARKGWAITRVTSDEDTRASLEKLSIRIGELLPG